MGRTRAVIGTSTACGLALACQLDGSGLGTQPITPATGGSSSGATGVASSSTTRSPIPDGTGSSAAPPTDTGPVDPSTSTGPGDPTSSPGSTTTPATTTGEFDCEGPDPFSVFMVVAEASTVDAPMTTVAAWGGLALTPDVVYSDQSNAGAITFEVDVPCEREYYAWALVWDRYHGAGPCDDTGNADNFNVSIDNGAETRWAYGCQSCDLPDATWFWAVTSIFEGGTCNHPLMVLDLGVGLHSFRFENRETGSFDPPESPDVAALAAFVLTDDPAYDPTADHPP